MPQTSLWFLHPRAALDSPLVKVLCRNNNSCAAAPRVSTVYQEGQQLYGQGAGEAIGLPLVFRGPASSILILSVFTGIPRWLAVSRGHHPQPSRYCVLLLQPLPLPTQRPLLILHKQLFLKEAAVCGRPCSRGPAPRRACRCCAEPG